MESVFLCCAAAEFDRVGARDPFIPVGHAVAAHEAIPGSRLEIFEGVGHYPHCEAPAQFVEVFVDFIASTEPDRLPPPHPPPPLGAAAAPGWEDFPSPRRSRP